jgi:hypothetical protein
VKAGRSPVVFLSASQLSDATTYNRNLALIPLRSQILCLETLFMSVRPDTKRIGAGDIGADCQDQTAGKADATHACGRDGSA